MWNGINYGNVFSYLRYSYFLLFTSALSLSLSLCVPHSFSYPCLSFSSFFQFQVGEAWSLSEVVHAGMILARFHTLPTIVFGCGCTEEVDIRNTLSEGEKRESGTRKKKKTILISRTRKWTKME